MKLRPHRLAALLLAASASGSLGLRAQAITPAVSESAWPSPVAKANSKLPCWLRFAGEERLRGEGTLGIGFKDQTDRYLLNRVRLDMQILPSNWLKFEFQAQDARAFWREEPGKPPYQNTWDLRLAYMELGNLDRYHAMFRMGRQELAFGDERLIGNSNWTNAARSFDGYRAAVRFKKFRVDAFAASVVVLSNGDVGRHMPGNYTEGLYGEIDHVIPNATVQPYFIWRRNPGQKLGNGILGTEAFGTTGVRWIGKLPANFSYNSETAIQRGSLGTDSVAAWATHLEIGHQFPTTWRWQPKYVAEYNYASGDRNVNDTTRGTFDTLYASSHNKIEFADQVGWKNVQEFRTGPDFKPYRKLLIAIRYADIWLANAHDALYASNGTPTVIRADGSAGRWVGQEFDGTAIYSFTKANQLGGGYGYLLPGTFLKTAAGGHAYSYPFLFYSTSF
ncbi:MAG TPA: alginate export family protein [Bryobacteraceae bacterium]|nr:alginate export family protein [Bryobacteraceae bacterium]